MNEKLKSWEFPKGSGIRIREKINTSGKLAYGVSFAVTVPSKVTGGARKRKQFDNRAKAEAYASDQWKGTQAQGQAFFEATRQERNEFAEVLPHLRKAGISLRQAVEFALPRLNPIGGNKTIEEIIVEIQDTKERRLEKGTLRPSSERDFRIRSKRINEAFGNVNAKDLRIDEIKEWIGSLQLSPRSIKNYTNTFSEILQYAVARQYVAENELNRLTLVDRREIYGVDESSEPQILTVKEAQLLLQTAQENPELELLAPVVLGLFCGLRTEEIKGLRWEDIRFDESFVTVGSKIAKKRRIRNVTLPENAKRWLSLVESREGTVTRNTYRNDYNNRFYDLTKKAGWVVKDTEENKSTYRKSTWKRNALRHSFGTYHFALYGDSIKTSNELGHRQGDSVLFDHYRALATREQGEAFFGIVPEATAEKTVRFA